MTDLLQALDQLRWLSMAVVPTAVAVVTVAILLTLHVRAHIREQRDAWLRSEK